MEKSVTNISKSHSVTYTEKVIYHHQVGFIPGNKTDLTLKKKKKKSKHLIYSIKEKILMILLTNAEKKKASDNVNLISIYDLKVSANWK